MESDLVGDIPALKRKGFLNMYLILMLKANQVF